MFAPDQNNTFIIVTLVYSQGHAVLFTVVLYVRMQPPPTFRVCEANQEQIKVQESRTKSDRKCPPHTSKTQAVSIPSL